MICIVYHNLVLVVFFFFFQAEDGIRAIGVTGVQTCALPISLHELDRTAPAPGDWRVELIGVPEGAEIGLHLRLESVMEGVLVSGDLDVPVVGSCARCLEPIEDTLHLDVQELYAYPGSTTEETSEEDEVRRLEGDYLDLEPLVRDTVVLSLPLAPVCTADCSGLCVDCGQRLDDLPAG